MFRIKALILAVVIFAACKKDDIKPQLAEGKISLEGVALKDTLIKDMHAGMDSAAVIAIKAVMNGEVSKFDHIVTIRTDTSRMRNYRAKYGDAKVLPAKNYFFYNSQTRIPAGASVSDSIELNITQQSSLRQLTEYVLPIVISQIDGSAVGVSQEEVLYLILKTGKSTNISKLDWTIASVSGEGGNSNRATNLLDNSPSTTWASGSSMPQNVVINFGEEIIFSGVTYTPDPALGAQGAYPTSVKIEFSLDGTTWEDKGTFEGSLPPAIWRQDFGLTSAQYMRFTVVNVVPVFGFFYIAYIGDISLIP